ncbi:MAG: dihydrodipicolinate synthase family protein [Sedimentisphaeraceae bacterium JB056]
MNPLNSSEIFGNWATLLLPLNSDDSIDYVLLTEEIDQIIACGVDGIYSNGSAGEFYNQTEEEFDKVSVILAQRCEKASMPYQLGASQMSPAISLERAKRASKLRPSAIQVILPDWFVPTIEEDVEFLSRIADAIAPVGIVLYNPPHAKRVLTPQQIGILKDTVPSLVGVKVCDGDENWYRQMREFAAGLSVFVPGHHLATGIQSGSHGAYSNVACIHPGVAQKWYQQMKTDIDSAIELQGRICEFMDENIVPFLKQGYSNMAVDKLLASVGGWCRITPRLRWPYKGIKEDCIEELRVSAINKIPEFFS